MIYFNLESGLLYFESTLYRCVHRALPYTLTYMSEIKQEMPEPAISVADVLRTVVGSNKNVGGWGWGVRQDPLYIVR